MTSIRLGAPIAALLILSAPVWAQAPATPTIPPAQPPAAATPATPAPTAAAPMTPAKPAPTAQAAAPARPQPKKHVVQRRVYREDYADTQQSADALNGQELAQSPIVASPPRPVSIPVYPAPAYPPPAYYPPPPPYYPPSGYWRPY